MTLFSSKKASNRPMSVGEVAAALGLPGPWTLRRLEDRGVVPPARRTLVTGQRTYSVAEIPELRRAIEEGPKR